MRLWPTAAAVLAAGAIVFLVVETRRLAELVGRQRLALQAAVPAAAELPTAQLPAVESRPAQPPGAAPAPPAGGDDPVAYAQLRLELETTRQRLSAVTALLAEHDRRAAARAAAIAARNRPVPEGVRQALAALQACLRAEGFLGPRFLRADSVGPAGLTGVEMLDAGADGDAVVVVHAQRMTATLDRGEGRLELRFYDGERSCDGAAAPLPDDGLPLVFADVDGRAVEARLPFLVRAEGAYPVEPPPGREPGEIDAVMRRQWLERFERLLADVTMQPRWRVTRVRGMADGWFLRADLVATDTKHHVVAGAHCARLAVEVDHAAGVVSLLLCDGSLNRGTIASTITGDGYRVLLPGVSCKQASDVMFGMVVTR